MKEYDKLCNDLRFGTRLLFRDLGDPWGHIAVRLPEGDKRSGFILKHVRVPPPPADPAAAGSEGRKALGKYRKVVCLLPLKWQTAGRRLWIGLPSRCWS